MNTQDTYTDRTVQTIKIDEIKDGAIASNSWWWRPPAEVLEKLEVGVEYIQETVRFSEVTGLATMYRSRQGDAVVLEWLMHKSDADLEREHEKFVADMNAKNEKIWEENQENWRKREAALPGPLKQRLQRFRDNGGHDFEIGGWGYELIICELAVLYQASGGEDTEEIMAFAREQGTSGNQHGFAKALAQGLDEDERAVANSVSALSPITGDPDYSKAGA